MALIPLIVLHPRGRLELALYLQKMAGLISQMRHIKMSSSQLKKIAAVIPVPTTPGHTYVTCLDQRRWSQPPWPLFIINTLLSAWWIRCEKVLKMAHFLISKPNLWPGTTKSNLAVDYLYE